MSLHRFLIPFEVALAACVLQGVPAQAIEPSACPFVYADSFTTSKADTESYSHSPITAPRPPGGSTLDGFLSYTTDPAGNRGLTFNRGFEGPAILRYLFPRKGARRLTGIAIAFDVAARPDGYPSWSLHVNVRYEGSGGFRQSIAKPGHYEFNLWPAASTDQRVVLEFLGGDCTLDNLVVCMDGVTAVQTESWGRFKARYR